MCAEALRIGIDFGTTNSALALASADGVEVAQYKAEDTLTRVHRSLLFFEEDAEWVDGRPASETGPEAIAQYLWTGGDGRLMQSMKSFLASRHMMATNVFGYDFKLEALVADVVRSVWLKAAANLGLDPKQRPKQVVAGRPVRFAFARKDADDAFAEERLRRGFALAGFHDVQFIFEPVAAAVHYEASLKRDEVVLVADFGGGTSDFCALLVGPSYIDRAADRTRVLATAGVGLAGDAFDARIVEQVVAPALGRGSKYRSQGGKVLEIPATVYKALSRWHDLSILKSPRNTQMLEGYRRNAVEPDKLRALCQVVDHDMGYALYREVQRAKVALSSNDFAEFRFDNDGVVVTADIERSAFEGWIAGELAEIRGGLDKVLERAGLEPDGVDTVFMTGGTAQVPAVRRIFETRFGAEKLRTSGFLTSVASGLASYARADLSQ